MSTKAVFALHRDDVGPALLEEAFRARVADTGVRRLQVNVDDADVAAAPLRFGPGTPITAVLSVWLDEPDDAAGAPGDALAAVVAVVREIDPTADGWRVDERRPIEPPPVPDGARADALANLAFLRRPAAMSPQDWLDDWLERHTPVAIATQGTFGYVQNPVLEALTPDAPEVAGIVEELFPMAAMEDTHAFYGSAGDDAELQRRFATLMESVARFGADHGLDLVPTSRYVWTLS
ncbi:EthD domain-containing protein [Nocardioides pocheonensis]|uniref:EthD domain-containing protein n=1 Tax=Nocardioides pocheonensis TaxID=661485 RepID=UPI001C839982|nr:EthD domain-containing protein [Nocardioides pocheonensis]